MNKYNRITKKETYYDKDDFELGLVIELDERHYETVQDIDTVCEKLNRLVELEDKLENGTLKQLPIRIGQTIYRKDAHFSWEITEARIYEDEIVFYDDSDNMIRVEDIGKKVFLTKAEAEQKRKETKNV